MKYQLRSLILTVPIYKVNVKITFVDSLKEYFDFKGYAYNLSTVEDCEAVVYFAQNRKYHMDMVFDMKGYRDDILVHELFHVVKGIFDTIGATLTDSSEEMWAYLLGDLYGKIKYLIYNNLLKEFDDDY